MTHLEWPAQFQSKVRAIAKWRWGTICLALPEVLAKLPALRLVWDHQKFMAGKDKVAAEGEVEMKVKDAAQVTNILKSQFFVSYSHMLLQLHLFGNFISTWASGCHCHGWLRDAKPHGAGEWNYIAWMEGGHSLGVQEVGWLSVRDASGLCFQVLVASSSFTKNTLNKKFKEHATETHLNGAVDNLTS